MALKDVEKQLFILYQRQNRETRAELATVKKDNLVKRNPNFFCHQRDEEEEKILKSFEESFDFRASRTETTFKTSAQICLLDTRFQYSFQINVEQNFVGVFISLNFC